MVLSDPLAALPAGLNIIEIPKENAVFRMDGRGRWCNVGGTFRNKKIIDHFNRSLGHDEKGWFVCQNRGDLIEKVYFPYEDTPLFVVDVRFEDPPQLILNTGDHLGLNPHNLRIQNDQLYQVEGAHWVKFSERCLMQISRLLEDDSDGFWIRLGNQKYPVLTD